jgi:ribosomal protein S19
MQTTKRKVLILRNRNQIITKKMINCGIFLYNGKKDTYVKSRKNQIGLKIGTLVATKKMGKNIHDSVRNKKKKNKQKK